MRAENHRAQNHREESRLDHLECCLDRHKRRGEVFRRVYVCESKHKRDYGNGGHGASMVSSRYGEYAVEKNAAEHDFLSNANEQAEE